MNKLININTLKSISVSLLILSVICIIFWDNIFEITTLIKMTLGVCVFIIGEVFFVYYLNKKETGWTWLMIAVVLFIIANEIIFGL